MSDTTLSTILDSRVKDAITELCRRRGIKMRYLIEKALIEQLEDEIDMEAFETRRSEETFSLEEILSGLEKKKRR